MHILAVDDESYALESIVHELEQIFPDVPVQAHSKASTALSWAEELSGQGEDLTYAFLDIQMRGINGLEVARRLKQLHPQVILFFCTAFSEYAYDAFGLCAKGYLLKPVQAKDIQRVLDEMVPNWKDQTSDEPLAIRVQTFGHFEVFLNDAPLVFEREKAKELLAYLVDRHGASITTEQIALTLWEDEVYDRRLKNRTTTIISSLRTTLREAGIEDLLVKTWNHLAVDVSRFRCDAYDFEKGDWDAVNSFRGEYMTNYSWAETTTGRYVYNQLT